MFDLVNSIGKLVHMVLASWTDICTGISLLYEKQLFNMMMNELKIEIE